MLMDKFLTGKCNNVQATPDKLRYTK